MDQRSAAMLGGYTALLSELVRLLINKGILTPDEIKEAVTEIMVRGNEHGKKPGFEAAPMHMLQIIESWQSREKNS